MTNHTSSVSFCRFSPDGKTIVSSSLYSTLKIWDAESATELTTLTGHEARVTSCCWSQDGQLIASVSDDGTIKIWNPLSSTEVDTLIGHGGPIRNSHFGNAGQIVTSSDDKTARIWEISAAKKKQASGYSYMDVEENVVEERQTFTGHTAQINDIRVSSNGEFILTASDDGTCRLWSTQSQLPLKVFILFDRPFTSCDISSALGFIVMSNDLGNVTVYDMNYEVVYSDKLSERPITSVRFGEGSTIIVGGWDSKILIIDLNGYNMNETGSSHRDWITCVASSPNNKYAASAGWDENCIVYSKNRDTYKVAFNLEGHTKTISGVSFSYDNRVVATSSFDGSVKLWNLSNGTLLTNIVGHNGRVNCVSFVSNMDNMVVSGCEDRYVRFFDYNSGNIMNEFVCQGPVNALHCIRPSGKSITMVAGDKIGNIYLTHLVKPGEY